MQLIEVSDFGVRSAQIWLSRRETPLRFVLFPMLHLGTAAYYEEVTRRLRNCQLVVAEGVGGESAAVRSLTGAYRIPSRRRRLELTTQQIDLSALGAPVINPDLTGEQFDAGWRRLPIRLRLMVRALVPIVATWLALAGSRALLASYLEVDDLPTREEIMASTGSWEPLDDLIVHERDAQLLTCLDEIHRRRSSEDLDVAIVYGAAHMRAVVHYLGRRYGYFARRAEWMTVFTL